MGTQASLALSLGPETQVATKDPTQTMGTQASLVLPDTCEVETQSEAIAMADAGTQLSQVATKVSTQTMGTQMSLEAKLSTQTMGTQASLALGLRPETREAETQSHLVVLLDAETQHSVSTETISVQTIQDPIVKSGDSRTISRASFLESEVAGEDTQKLLNPLKNRKSEIHLKPLVKPPRPSRRSSERSLEMLKLELEVLEMVRTSKNSLVRNHMCNLLDSLIQARRSKSKIR